MKDWYGVIVFLVAMAAGLLVAWLLLRRSSSKGDSSGSYEYDKLVMRTILPSNHGIPIDKVYDALKGMDFQEFHLDSCSGRDENNAKRDV